MKSTEHSLPRIVGDAELRGPLEHALSEYFGSHVAITQIQRRSSICQSSYALEELDLVLDGGAPLHLLFKNLSPQALLAPARNARPAFLQDPRREIEVYRHILARTDLGTAACYGTVLNQESERYWLFLEKVAGLELYQVGDLATWQEVARWLAAFHSRFGEASTYSLGSANLLNYDARFYELWMERAHALDPTLGPLSQAYTRVVEYLQRLPRTLIHGEFYASNVLVAQSSGGLRVCPVDWETTAIGPALMDLAALTAGKWSEEARTTIAMAYWHAHGDSARFFATPEVFLEALDYCRLHQAVQWMGWSTDWEPPVEQAQDWRGAALALAKKLDLLTVQ